MTELRATERWKLPLTKRQLKELGNWMDFYSKREHERKSVV